ncbi:tyrosine-type recombinase/integrase [Nocardioides terrisoli]|uniref:tyrosine-type recombinase/integrase n=1 Tax=Nocardioides terrisoli TaxID=3388267 RepID=UPI00287B9F77|nr:site-specific integrase [Nocardioides marmorisolisilvae]
MASIRERTYSSGETTWAVLYRHGKRQTSLTFTDPKSAAKFAQLIDLLGADKALAVHRGEAHDDRLTVAELAEQYLANRATKVTERTMTDYRRDVANWILPWFGHRTAESLNEADVQKWVDHMARSLAPKSVGDRHMLLHSMYKYGTARSRQLVSHNPCLETEFPAPVRKPPKGTTTPEFRSILAAALAKGNPDAHDLILFLGETGWRFSEAIALDTRDVDDDGIDVWVNMSRVYRLDASGRPFIAEDAAKTEAGFRRIRMLPESAAMVRARMIGKAQAGELVFTNSRGRPWNQNTFLRTTWPGILKVAALGDRRPTPHWLRHMHVAVMAAAGAPMHEIQRRIGHDHYSTTVDVYGGMIGDVSDDTLARAAALMSGRASAPGIAPVVAGEVVRAELGQMQE